MRISVVTVCFNAEATIAQTIRSVAQQNWPDFEHIIVDGASSDNTLAVVKSLQHERMRVISEPDEGLYDAMNKGLAASTGIYVGFLNADDFFESPDSLRKIGEAADRTGADCILGDTIFVDGQGRPKGRLYSARKFKPWWLRVGAMPPHPSFYARRARLLEVGGFDTRYKIAADFDLIARLILGGNASWAAIGSIISCFRLGGVSTANAKAKLIISREMADSLRRMGQPLANLAVQVRYVLKLLQYWRPLSFG